MSTTALIVSILAAAMSLFLVVRNFQGQGLSLGTTARMALAWVAIIGFVVLVVRQIAG